MPQDVELYELNVLQGATEMLAECTPVLFIEMLCEKLNKSIMLLLDRLGYSMAWVVAAVVEHDELAEYYIADQQQFPWITFEMIYGGANLIAVPKSRRGDFAMSSSRFVFSPIDVSSGGDAFHIPPLALQVCHGNHQCFTLRQSQGEACESISGDLIEYWRELVY